MTESKSVQKQEKKHGFFEDLIYGAIIPFRALDLIFSSPRLLLLSILPVLLSVGIIALFFYLGVTRLSTWAALQFHQWTLGAGNVLMYGFIILSAIVLAYCCIQAVGMILSLIASPLNDLLAKQTEINLKVNPHPETNLSDWMSLMFLDARKTILSLCLLVVFSVGLLIPGLNILFFLATALLNAFTFITYPQSRRHMGVIAALQWMKGNFASCLGFGILIGLLFGAPLINLFALPVAVVGGTMLYFRK